MVKSVNLLQIKYKEKIYDVYDFSLYCKKRKLLQQEEIKNSQIIYDGVVFDYSDYVKDLKQTSKKFKKDNSDTQHILNPDFVFLYDKNLYVCLRYLGSLCSNITAGNHYALLSYDKIPIDLYGIKSYVGCYFRRCMDFSTSILWYNSTLDYFLQIFCSKFNFYNNITNKDVKKMNFEEIAKLCSYIKIRDAISKIKKDKNNKEMFKWWDLINSCYQNTSWIREIANSLKHKSGVFYENLDLPPLFKITKGDLKMEDVYVPKKVDIDRDFEKIIDSHNEIVKVYHFIIRRINKEIENNKNGSENNE